MKQKDLLPSVERDQHSSGIDRGCDDNGSI